MSKKTKAIVAIPADKIALEAFKASKFKAKPTEQVIEATIDELEALLVQRTKEAREDTMKIFWETGELLRQKERENKVSISGLVSRVALDNRISGRQMGERNLWFAIKFHDTFPKFGTIYETEHGENISISKVKKLLITPKPKKAKTLQIIAYDLVDKLGADEAQKLIIEIEKEIERREKQGK
jgi:hypothetical protein